MYYNTLQEAIDAAPDCTHVLTTGHDWDRDEALKGKFQPVHKSGGSYYDYQGEVNCMSDDCWVVAWTRGEKMTRTEAAYDVMSVRFDEKLILDKSSVVRGGHEFTKKELVKYRQLVNDGYTLWLDGGECPVDEGVRVDVVLSNWHEEDDCDGSRCIWAHDGEMDIIAYRAVGEETKDSGAFEKVAHYTDQTGTDLIDDFARHRTPEQFRGAMMFILEKYIRRCGKKDDIEDEVYKIADYANRWLEYERKLK